MDDPATDDQRPPPDEERPTLGRLLDAQARRRTQALQPRLAWARPLATLMRKVEQLGDGVGDRFDRFEGRPSADPTASGPTVAALVRPGDATARRTGAGAAETAGHRPRRDRTATMPQEPLAHQGLPAEAWPGDDSREPGRDGVTGDGRSDRGVPSEARDLPPSTRYRLRQEVGAAADAMRVHDGPHADALARAAGADAVTVGREVHLRQGRYAPHREDGQALLAHEATHVAAVLEPGHAWRKAVGDDAEERLALDRETRMLGGTWAPRTSAPLAPPILAPSGPAAIAPGHAVAPTGAGRAVPPPAPSWAPPVATTTAPPGSPRAADADRDLTAGPAAPPDLEALRRGVVADVMRQIKTEFERGG